MAMEWKWPAGKYRPWQWIWQRTLIALKLAVFAKNMHANCDATQMKCIAVVVSSANFDWLSPGSCLQVQVVWRRPTDRPTNRPVNQSVRQVFPLSNHTLLLNVNDI